MYRSEILSKNSKASFARSSSCLCKKLIFWWERDDDWQPRLLGGLALGRWSLRVLTHLPGFVPPELCLTSPDHQPVDPLEPHFGPVLVPSFLSEFPPIRGLLAATVSPLQLNLKLWINLNVNFTFNQSASLFQVFYPNDPISTNQKPSSHKPPTRRVTWC